MLAFIRDRAHGWFAWFIVIILIVPFALWGINEYFSPEAEVNVAVVNDTKISSARFQQAYQQQRSRLQAMLGANFDPAIFDDKTMKNDVLEGLIGREVLLQAALDAKMRIGDMQVAQQIRTISAVQSEGQFDAELYNRLLRSQGMSVGGFEQSVRTDLLVEQIRSGVAETTFVPAALVDALIRVQNEQRDVGYVVVPAARFIEQAQFDDQQVQTYYEVNRERFRTTEQVSVDYLELSLDTLAAGVSVNEDDVRASYEQRAAEFGVPEERRARHILLQVGSDAPEEEVSAAKAKIEGLLTQVREGAAFEELAKAQSQDPGSAGDGGDLGFFGRGMMDRSFEDATFALQVGEVSEPVRSTFGYHIIKLEEVRGGDLKPFEEVRAQVERDLKRTQAEAQFFEQVEQLANLAFEHPDNLTAAAAALDLEVKTSDFFTAEKGAGIAANARVRNAAYSDEVLLGGHNSELVELRPDHIVALRLQEHRPATVRPLDEVSSEIRSALRLEFAREQAEALGRELLAAIEEGADAAEVVKQHELSWERAGMIDRLAASVNREVVAAAFRAQRPTEAKPVYQGLALGNGDYAVAAVYAVQEGDPSLADAATRERVVKELSRDYADAEFVAYMNALKASAEIKRYPDNL